MIDRHHLNEAVRRGILSDEQVQQLVDLAEAEQLPELPAGDEQFRLVGGGNDVFVGLGVLLLLVGVSRNLRRK